jgi:Family of unknown function (DUF6337)
MDLAIVVALLAEVIVLSWLEHGSITTRVTPFNVLAFPYAIVVVIAFFAAPALDLVPLSKGSVVIWMCGLFLVWLTGLLTTRGFLGGALTRRVSGGLKSAFCTEASSTRLALWLGVLAIPLIPYKLLEAKDIAGGWWMIGSQEFKAAYLHGPLAHVVVLCGPIVILLLGTATSKTKLQLAVAGTLLVFIFFGQAKGITLQPIVGGLLYRVMRGRTRISLKTIGIILLCGVLVFGTVDLITWAVTDYASPLTADPYAFIARHFCFYLLAGPLAFSESVREGNTLVDGGPEAIFAPFVNLYRIISGSGNLVTEGTSKGRGEDIDLLSSAVGHSSNVFTYFGTLYLYLGGLGAAIYAGLAGLLCYLLLITAAGTRNELLLALYCCIASQLFFGFFELFFWHLTVFEVSGFLLGGYFLQCLCRTRAERSAALSSVHA